MYHHLNDDNIINIQQHLHHHHQRDFFGVVPFVRVLLLFVTLVGVATTEVTVVEAATTTRTTKRIVSSFLPTNDLKHHNLCRGTGTASGEYHCCFMKLSTTTATRKRSRQPLLISSLSSSLSIITKRYPHYNNKNILSTLYHPHQNQPYKSYSSHRNCEVGPLFLQQQQPHNELSSDRMATIITENSNEDGHNQDPLIRLGLPSPLILGSASFTRKQILDEIQIPYQCMIRSIDEKNIGNREVDSPRDLVQKVATAKMNHLVQCLQNEEPECIPQTTSETKSNSYIVMTADQVVTCHDRILEKPTSLEEAIEFITLYGTYPVQTIGAVVMHHIPSDIRVLDHHIATIHFKSQLSIDAPNLVNRMMEQYEKEKLAGNTHVPSIFQCAGGLMIEHPFVQEYIDHIDGTMDSIMGLDKSTVLQLLQQIKDQMKEEK